MTETDTYSPEEAFNRLGIARSAGYAALRRGQIPSIRIGRLFRIPKRGLERLLEGNLSAVPKDAA